MCLSCWLFEPTIEIVLVGFNNRNDAVRLCHHLQELTSIISLISSDWYFRHFWLLNEKFLSVFSWNFVQTIWCTPVHSCVGHLALHYQLFIIDGVGTSEKIASESILRKDLQKIGHQHPLMTHCSCVATRFFVTLADDPVEFEPPEQNNCRTVL